MVDAGIQTPDEVIKAFKAMQQHKGPDDAHFVIYKIENKKQVAVEYQHPVSNEWDWDEFIAKITESGEPRFATIDFYYKRQKDDRDDVRVLFVAWTPETSRPGDKMLYASTKEGFKSKLDGVQKTLQATDESELDYEHAAGVVDSL